MTSPWAQTSVAMALAAVARMQALSVVDRILDLPNMVLRTLGQGSAARVLDFRCGRASTKVLFAVGVGACYVLEKTGGYP